MAKGRPKPIARINTGITIEEDLKQELDHWADYEDRTFSALIGTMLRWTLHEMKVRGLNSINLKDCRITQFRRGPDFPDLDGLRSIGSPEDVQFVAASLESGQREDFREYHRRQHEDDDEAEKGK